MNIDDIKPYENNARHNEKAIPVVAESIKTFGFKGAIVLRSKDDPTIVNGHTRVAACKLLGWTEFPDEYIVYADDLTDEEVRALRLADNRTGEVAKWNPTLLQREMRGIKSLDMSKFKFEFKSEHRPRGAERLRTDKAYNLHLVNIGDCAGKEGYPILKPVDAKPRDFVSFNFYKQVKERDVGLHFCIDDYKFERVWNEPEKYLDAIKEFECVVTPDFSVYLDMPVPMRKWNIYRSRALGNWWQRHGVTVVPNLTFSDADSIEYSTDGMPKHSTVFLSTLGVNKDKRAREICLYGMKHSLRRVEPSRVLLLGDDLGFDFGDVEVVRYNVRQF